MNHPFLKANWLKWLYLPFEITLFIDVIFRPIFLFNIYPLPFSEITASYTIFGELGNNGDLSHDGSDYGLTTEVFFNGDYNSGFYIFTNYDSSDDTQEQHYIENATKIKQAIINFLLL